MHKISRPYPRIPDPNCSNWTYFRTKVVQFAIRADMLLQTWISFFVVQFAKGDERAVVFIRWKIKISSEDISNTLRLCMSKLCKLCRSWLYSLHSLLRCSRPGPGLANCTNCTKRMPAYFRIEAVSIVYVSWWHCRAFCIESRIFCISIFLSLGSDLSSEHSAGQTVHSAMRAGPCS